MITPTGSVLHDANTISAPTAPALTGRPDSALGRGLSTHTSNASPTSQPIPPSDHLPNQLCQEWQQLFRDAPHHQPTAPTEPDRLQMFQELLTITSNLQCGATFTQARQGLRIWSNNVNSLSMGDDFAEFRELCDQLGRCYANRASLSHIRVNNL